jgi:hypothetical protein
VASTGCCGFRPWRLFPFFSPSSTSRLMAWAVGQIALFAAPIVQFLSHLGLHADANHVPPLPQPAFSPIPGAEWKTE